jgi:hypothetical protein
LRHGHCVDTAAGHLTHLSDVLHLSGQAARVLITMT